MAKNERAPAIEMKIDIVESPNKPVIPVAGIFGGLNSQGLLVAHLYIEYSDLL